MPCQEIPVADLTDSERPTLSQPSRTHQRFNQFLKPTPRAFGSFCRTKIPSLRSLRGSRYARLHVCMHGCAVEGTHMHVHELPRARVRPSDRPFRHAAPPVPASIFGQHNTTVLWCVKTNDKTTHSTACGQKVRSKPSWGPHSFRPTPVGATSSSLGWLVRVRRKQASREHKPTSLWPTSSQVRRRRLTQKWLVAGTLLARLERYVRTYTYVSTYVRTVHTYVHTYVGCKETTCILAWSFTTPRTRDFSSTETRRQKARRKDLEGAPKMTWGTPTTRATIN